MSGRLSLSDMPSFVQNFFDGVNRAVNPYAAQDREADLAVNVAFPRVGSFTARRGYDLTGNDMGSSSITSQHQFSTAGGTRYHIATHGQKVMYNNAGTWTEIGTNVLTTNLQNYFEHFTNLAIITNGTDAPQKITNTTTIGAVGGSPPTARYVKAFQTRLYMARTTANPSRVFYSALGNAESWTTSTDYFDVKTDDGEDITGLATLSNRLLVFKESSIHRYDTSTLVQANTPYGAISGRTIANIGNFVAYLSRKGRGVYLFDGVESKLISRPVQPWIDAMDWTTLFQAVADESSYWLFIGSPSVTIDGVAETYTNCVLEYRYLDSTWVVHTLAHAANSWTVFTNTSGSKDVYFGSSSGDVYQWLTDNDDQTTAINMRYRTGLRMMGSPHTVKRFKRLWLYGGDVAAQGVQVAFRLMGQSNWTVLGILDRSYRMFPFPAGARGRGLQFQFTSSGTELPIEIMQYEIDFEPEEQDDTGKLANA